MADVPTIETLSAVVDGHSRQFEALHKEVAAVGNRVEVLFDNLSSKLDQERKAAYAEQLAALASNRPDYKGIVGAAATVAAVFVTVFVTIGSMALSPIRESELDRKAEIREVQELQQRRNLAMEAETAKVADEVVASRISLANLQGQVTERHEQYLRDDARHESRETSIDSQLIKRPEIEAINAAITDTVSRLSARLAEMQHEFGANFTLGDAVKEMQARLNALQLQTNTSSVVAPPSHP